MAAVLTGSSREKQGREEFSFHVLEPSQSQPSVPEPLQKRPGSSGHVQRPQFVPAGLRIDLLHVVARHSHLAALSTCFV